ncbi:uncharacterized protein LAESUDRAFT_652182 [Laetiporus sulphureus 93-53]|uniref:Vacuolar sorting protein 39/Transforming growth factor beta receptor-associated domain-containing protein n=1 Tax=Laetiporus sulphureus 93-53 TaxID=1314785 RepID=A0A165EGU5_9APHY|nr:uncharacterized protein LAESUDRAFT_652182 [Laetiporus sulphureus 93-53]KZT07025.1 hypothetical protein LAESUDRAFT_652182 [Laetiporus sulphureus 93-53]
MAARYASFPRANVLVLGSNSVQALLPSTLISQADALLDAHRIEDAVELAEQQLKKLQQSATMGDIEEDELFYVYQRLGLQCLCEVRFDDAGKHLFAGGLDPRVLISYYPDFRGNLFGDMDSVDMFAGVAEHMPREESVDEIIAANLVLNYSPHLPPNTRTAPEAVELLNALKAAARHMLEVYLRHWRKKCMQSDVGYLVNLPAIAVDTVLAELFIVHDVSPELHVLISQPNAIVLSEVEPLLVQHRQFAALCSLYQQQEQDDKLLEAWAKLVDGEWTDGGVGDPLSNIFTLLSEKRDRALTQQWGAWLVKRDADRALKLFMSFSSSRRVTEDDRMLLEQIQEADPKAGARYLEFLVLQKRSNDADLHMQLAMTCVDQLLECVADEQTSKLWRAKASSYATSHTDTFLSYFASTTPDTEATRTRIKTVLFLQGSTQYDAQAIRDRLSQHEKLLRLELAIVDGKLGKHQSALTSLVHNLRDTTSAEIYCTLGGEVIPLKTAQSLGERFALQPWAALLAPPTSGKTRPGAPPLNRLATVDGDLKKSLIKILLEVYMSGGEEMAEQTARFLNAQAMNLDELSVIALVPPEWPLRVLSTFVARSLRRTLHARHEGLIVKAISAGENLTVTEKAWYPLREAGALIEEAADDGPVEGEKLDEKGQPMSFDEKVSLALATDVDSATRGSIVEIPDPPAKETPVPPGSGFDVEVGT